MVDRECCEKIQSYLRHFSITTKELHCILWQDFIKLSWYYHTLIGTLLTMHFIRNLATTKNETI